MPRPIAFDITHLTHRQHFLAPSGIEKVDLAYARHFGRRTDILCSTVHYGLKRPLLGDPAELTTLARTVEQQWSETISIAADRQFQAVRAWLLGKATRIATAIPTTPRPRRELAINVRTWLKRAVRPLLWNRGPAVPKGAIYLNVAQHAFEIPRYFSWLKERSDLQRVFFVHDLLPVDYPEFWPAGHEDIFRRRVDCFIEHATALITTSAAVAERAEAEFRKHGRSIPIFAASFPSPLSLLSIEIGADESMASVAYFVAVNTLEPRKNHLLLLNIWRDLVQSGAPVPKLILVGKRGWEYDQIVGLIERSPSLQDHVIEVSGLSNAGLNALITNARALLMPSFAEGFGLAVVEALGLGTPVIASDLPVFREVSQGCALFHHPLDGLGWRQTILELSTDTPLAHEARAAARDFVPVDGASYFAKVEGFLASL